MSNVWQNINPPVPLSKMIPVAAATTPVTRLERESPRPVIGMLPQSLKPRAQGLPRDRSTCPLPVDVHPSEHPKRLGQEIFPSAIAAGNPEPSTAIPRVTIENFPRLESQPLKKAEGQDASIGRSRLEALNGRLMVRSRIDFGQYSCTLDTVGTRQIAAELGTQALVRDLIVLESSVRGVEMSGLYPLVEASLVRARPNPVHRAVRLPKTVVLPRIVGPVLRITLPVINQPS